MMYSRSSFAFLFMAMTTATVTCDAHWFDFGADVAKAAAVNYVCSRCPKKYLEGNDMMTQINMIAEVVVRSEKSTLGVSEQVSGVSGQVSGVSGQVSDLQQSAVKGFSSIKECQKLTTMQAGQLTQAWETSDRQQEEMANAAWNGRVALWVIGAVATALRYTSGWFAALVTIGLLTWLSIFMCSPVSDVIILTAAAMGLIAACCAWSENIRDFLDAQCRALIAWICRSIRACLCRPAQISKTVPNLASVPNPSSEPNSDSEQESAPDPAVQLVPAKLQNTFTGAEDLFA
jgi:hypothetical protein